ncbi:MAG: hypothetical protein K2X32_05390, partial [Phycisphaerales bacterium]|nr:hypothetical protein [Phycisphaerales bacterium]
MSALPHPAALPVSDLEIDVLGPLPDAPPGVLPKTGVVLIGTPATIRQMATGLCELDTPCVVTGCIGLDTFAIGRQEAGRAEGALPQLLGTIADL